MLPADILQEILLKEQELLQPGILGDDEDEDGEEEDEDEDEEEEEDLDSDRHCAERDSLLSTSSAASRDSTLSLASSQASGPTLHRQLLTSFVSGLSDGMDSGYVEDSEESSFERPKSCQILTSEGFATFKPYAWQKKQLQQFGNTLGTKRPNHIVVAPRQVR